MRSHDLTREELVEFMLQLDKGRSLPVADQQRCVEMLRRLLQKDEDVREAMGLVGA